MGRLFWKFLLFIWLAQMVGMVGVGAAFWVERYERNEARALAAAEVRHGQPPGPLGEALRPPDISPPPPDDRDRPPPPRNGRHHPGFIPIEPLIGNFVVTLLCAVLLAWYCSKPIRNLRRAFDAVAAGNLDVRLEQTMGRGRSELVDLGRDFDRMASQLQMLMNSQRHLLYDVSHELRSPLARLQAAIGLARQSPEKFSDTLERIELESSRINQLVGELLTLSRLEAGVMGDFKDEVGMAELMEDLLEDARFEAGLRECEVDYRGDCDVVVRGRAELLYRAVENVVRNAVKYTSSHSVITIRAEYDAVQQMLKLFVLDKGPGVPEAELGKIFTPFFRSGSTAKTDGHGLGLAIAKRVVEAHGGMIIASNRASGGLCIEIDLPAQKSSLPPFTPA